MEQLVALIEQYRPGTAQQLVAADETDVFILEDLAGPLPGAYTRFLRTMGASLGPLALAEAYFGIEGLAATYEQKPWLRRDRYLLVAGDAGLTDSYYFLDRTRPYADDDCMVVRMPLVKHFDPDRHSPTHAGFEEFLYFEVFKALRLPLLPHGLEFAESDVNAPGRNPNSAESVRAFAEQHGFTRIPPAERCALYDRSDAGLLLYQHPIEPTISFTLGCDDPKELDRLAKELEARTGMKGRP